MGTGGGPKAQKELLSSARKRRAAEQKAAEQEAAGQEAAEQEAAEQEAAGQLVFSKQMPSAAGARGKRQRGGLRPPSPDAGGAGRGSKGKTERKPERKPERKSERKTKLVPYAQHVLGLQTARMQAVMVGQQRGQHPVYSDKQQSVFEATRSALSFVPPALAEGVARVRAGEAGNASEAEDASDSDSV
jgi:hypothetical protein